MSYRIAGSNVLWHEWVVRKANAASFEALSTHFARDREAIYVCARRFPEGHPPSLEVVQDRASDVTHYARDREHVYKTNLPRIERRLHAPSLLKLDDYYAADREHVFCLAAERVLGSVPAGTFEVLGHGYGRAGDHVYHGVERVVRAHAPSFEALAPDLARDGARVYVGAAPVPGVASREFRHVAGIYWVHAERDVYLGGHHILAAHAPSFQFLGSLLCKDRARVYLAGGVVAEADAATFHLNHHGAQDAHGRYTLVLGPTARLGTGHVEPAAKLMRVPEAHFHASPGPKLTVAVRAWWVALEAHLFPLLDAGRSQWPPDELDRPWPSRSSRDSRLDITMEGTRLNLRCGGLDYQCQLSGFLHAQAAAWAWQRKHVFEGRVCLRLLDERVGFMGPDGDLVRARVLQATFAQSLAVLDALAHEGDEARIELRLLGGLLARQARWNEAQLQTLAARMLVWGLQGFAGHNDRGMPRATTNLAAIKRLASSPSPFSKDVLERVSALAFLHARLQDLDERKARHLPALLRAFLPLLADAHSLVRDKIVESLDLGLQKLLGRIEDEHDGRTLEAIYTAGLELLPELLNRGVEMDVNLARLWACQLGLKRRAEAEATWERLVRASEVLGSLPSAALPRSPVAMPLSWRAWRDALTPILARD